MGKKSLAAQGTEGRHPSEEVRFMLLQITQQYVKEKNEEINSYKYNSLTICREETSKVAEETTTAPNEFQRAD